MNYSQMQACAICPRECGVNRYESQGFCGAGAELKVNLAAVHHGEEPPLSGTNGSGTIFFSWCNLHCVFCQNDKISNLGWGEEVSSLDLANLMLSLQEQGAHNINLVTPTHFTPQIVSAIEQAKTLGLNLPVVWNSSAYESVETLQSLAGLVDIYLPDLKYAHGVHAKKYSHAQDYPDVAIKAIKEMHSQVGALRTDEHGIAKKGLIVRLLVLPGALSGTQKSLYRIAEEIGTDVTLSLMGQYYPAGDAHQYPELGRGILEPEYQAVVNTVQELNFDSVFVQELSCSDTWTPKFRKEASCVETLKHNL